MVNQWFVTKHQICEGTSSIIVGNQENAINVKLVFCFLTSFFYTGVQMLRVQDCLI